MPPDGPEEWPKADSRKQWLVFYKLDQMTFNGSGTIEGNGQKWWELPCKPHRVIHLKFNFNHLGNSFAVDKDEKSLTLLMLCQFRVQTGRQHQDHVIAQL